MRLDGIITSAFALLALAPMAFTAGCFYDTDKDPAPVDTDTSDTDTGEPDAGDTGIGTECQDDDDCAGLEADYCALNPMAPSDPGYCTISGCAPGECPAGYQCCDFTDVASVDYPVMCVDDAMAATVEGYGATCS